MGIKLNFEKAEEIRGLYRDKGWLVARIAKEYGVAITTICNIITGKTWGGKHTVNLSRHNPKLNFEKAEEIRGLYLKGRAQSELAKKYRVAKATVSLIITGKTWKSENTMNLSWLTNGDGFAEAEEIRGLHLEGWSRSRLAKEYSKSRCTIGDIIRGELWGDENTVNLSIFQQTRNKGLAKAQKIRKSYLEGRTLDSIAKEYGLSWGSIARIIRGEMWGGENTVNISRRIITQVMAEEIRARYLEGRSYSRLVEEYRGVTKTTVAKIITGETWKGANTVSLTRASGWATPEVSIRTIHPEWIPEWHPTKNGDRTVDNVSFSSGRKFWWICPSGHEYEMRASGKNSGNGCRECYRKYGWKAERKLFKALQAYFLSTETINGARPSWLGLQHLDIYFPEFNIGIEYQGGQHFKSVKWFGGEKAFKKIQERDARKKRLCKENGCELFCVEQNNYDYDELIRDIQAVMDQRQFSDVGQWELFSFNIV